MNNKLSLKNINVKYGESLALKSINLDIYKGEFVVLLGSSGAGKSTLLRTINQLNQLTSGELDFFDLGKIRNKKDLQNLRKKTGMIFQQHQLIERNTVFQNVLTGRLGFHSLLRSILPLPKFDQELALDCIDRVNLLDKALVKVKELSGGQQQRVGIARALAQNPSLILADEPIASLDPKTSHQVLSMLKDICKKDNISALTSLHQVDFAKEYGDRIIGLSHGKIVFNGKSDQLSDEILKNIYSSSPIAEEANFTSNEVVMV